MPERLRQSIKEASGRGLLNVADMTSAMCLPVLQHADALAVKRGYVQSESARFRWFCHIMRDMPIM